MSHHAIAPAILVVFTILSTATAMHNSRLAYIPEVMTDWPHYVASLISRFWDVFKPGGQFHPESFIENKGHLVLEGVLIAVISYLFLQKSFNPKAQRQQHTELTEQEIDALCTDWQPEPLFKAASKNQPDYESPVMSGVPSVYTTANDKQVLNMVSWNFLGLAGDSNIQREARNTINKYGLGSCGPRGFYGTIDVHLTLEQKIAKFMGTQESIIYAYDLATVPSVLPAFASAKDLIICDEAASFGIQNGALLSRAQIRYFKHNDVEDLEEVLKAQAAKDRKSKLRLNRRFIVVEGISENRGDITPLDKIFELKEKYKYRLVLDESLSLGVLGKTGRGAAEHFGIEPGQIELVAASLGNSLASIGGFCAGEREVVDHQRLSGLGYCFSASLPPYLASAAIEALDRLQQEPALAHRVAKNAVFMRRLLSKIPGLQVHGREEDIPSPLIHVQLAQPPEEIWQGKAHLQKIVEDAFDSQGVMFTVHRLSDLDRAYVHTPASIVVAVTAKHTDEDLQRAADALQAAVDRCL